MDCVFERQRRVLPDVMFPPSFMYGTDILAQQIHNPSFYSARAFKQLLFINDNMWNHDQYLNIDRIEMSCVDLLPGIIFLWPPPS